MPQSPNIHLIVGEDDYLVESAARKILEAAVEPSLRGTAVETISGEAGNMEEQLASLASCRASVQTPPFLDPVKLTWWRNVNFLPGGARNGSPGEEVRKALEGFAASLAESPLPPNQVLIVTANKLLKTSRFAKTFQTFAQVVEFASGGKSRDRVESALMRLPDLAAEERLTFDAGAAQAFIAKVGADTRVIVSELAKLRTYLGTARDNVTPADIAEVVSVGGEEPELWDVTDALAQRNPTKLLKTLARFDGEKGYGILLSTITEKFFRELVVYRDALDNGWLTPYGTWAKTLPPDVAEALDAAGIGPGVSRGSWAVRNGARNAKAFTLNELRAARFRMLKVRERLVSSTADDSLVDQELLRIVARRPAR
ncbi:MAG: DNA polymerase III subunit delta [Kiritimatiellia bacterium]